MPTYQLKIPNTNESFDILITKIESQYIEIAFDKGSEAANSIAKLTSLKKYPFLEIIQQGDDSHFGGDRQMTVTDLASRTLKTPPASFVKIGDHNLKTYRINFDTPQNIFANQQLDLCRVNENDRANIARYLTSINDITFGIQKDKMASANKNAEGIRGLL
jgi:hypothetical protein